MLREVSKDYITSAKPNASFSINTGSDSNYYQLKLPYQITYEFCSGTEEDDYMHFMIIPFISTIITKS